MFIYLSKKIAIPNQIKLHSLSWNPEQGWIACGGANGLLKVLKLDSTGGSSGDAATKPRGVAAPSNLSMNQTLEGHQGGVMCVTWNANYRKLTTSDQNGLIIVWTLHKGMWSEEMINNRNKSVVRDMKWTADGQKICIIYEDGAVIVGSVEGTRLWGNDLDAALRFVEWSPDSRNILFVTRSNEIHMYDHHGNKIKALPLYALEQKSEKKGFDSDDDDDDEDEEEDTTIIGIHWYDGTEGHLDLDAPTLAVAFKNGKVQIGRGEEDPNATLIDTRMTLSQCKWNAKGNVLALAGSQKAKTRDGEEREISMIKFYTPLGEHVRSLKVPGSNGISALSWEGSGLRIALAVDAFIYFANIRPDYMWGCFGHTLVYAHNKPDRVDVCVTFWNMNSEERRTKHIKGVKFIRAAGENALVVIGQGKEANMPPPVGDEENVDVGPKPSQHILMLCNAIGSPVDTKYIDIKPIFVEMTETHVVVSDYRSVYVWQYRTNAMKMSGDGNDNRKNSAAVALLRRNTGRERMFDIEDVSSSPAQPVDEFKIKKGRSKDGICAITASKKNLIISRESGTIHRYTLPHIGLENKFSVKCWPSHIRLNCDSTALSIIDNQGILNILDLDNQNDGSDGNKATFGKLKKFERKDAWDLQWASDNPNLFAVMEKTRMYVFRNLQPEEPVLSSGYFSKFADLQIQAIMLDEIMATPDSPDKDMVLDFETKSLRDAGDLISNVGLAEATAYIEEHSHPRLWKLLGEAALEALDFAVAEKAFVNIGDYPGIQYVKRLSGLGEKMKQRAEVAAYFQRFDEAEAILREIDRKDLANDLRIRLGDWFRVVTLVQTGGGDDKMLLEAWNNIGEYYADRFKWSKAATYFSQAKNLTKTIDCYYRMDDFEGMEKSAAMISDGNPALMDVGKMFENVGLHRQAVECYQRAGDVKAAIDACVMLNYWEDAVKLAEAHGFSQIEGLLAKYAGHLLSKGDKLQAVELYRKADKATEAARLLAGIAEDVGKRQVDPLRAKKLHVLAALEVERYRKKALDLSNMTTTKGKSVAATTAATLDTLMTADAESRAGGAGGKGSKVMDNAWRGAEAYHYYLLAHRQLYKGDVDAAMKTAIRCAEFEDVLDRREIYSLIALTSYHSGHLNICSRAFIKLETLPDLDKKTEEGIQNLALKIFINQPPRNPSHLPHCYISCLETGTPYSACTITGRAVLDARTVTCKVCGHMMLEHELSRESRRSCPLCHGRIEMVQYSIVEEGDEGE
mmetsp:Transcript_6986/g.14069  ORF Transcript_6986/g.14069 Transcript_6986/m.14069 type:complete len:1248 (+) Transcript_6986:71-3814(+)|eukprot:CAMPEP_0118646514 /NCGR_PEP_ID=MMETSP0785-20121206/8101_1 /TAXON_ID=91992 /ORGANISM="Bolidomonas pacifica, Strain CCMP 1866" /LENGTH=1247 /DNA_ID=CAMNT_0006538521 /DNA_START=16 /DNA_END=3762 /DNA_ORIENTATION=+